MSWADVDALRTFWKGPLILKGILHPLEAQEAAARGVDGIVVSNHGGRQLDGAAASIEALPAVLAAVDARIQCYSMAAFVAVWTWLRRFVLALRPALSGAHSSGD